MSTQAIPARDRALTQDVRESVLNDPEGGFKNDGEFYRYVRAREIHDANVLKQISPNAAAYGNATYSGDLGGFAIYPALSNKILTRAESKLGGVIGRCLTIVLQDGNNISITGGVDHDASDNTYRHSGIVTYWLSEAAQITRTDIKLRQIQMRVEKLIALIYLTGEELAAIANIGELITNLLADAIADELIEAIFFGNGVGRPLGAFVAGCCIEVAKEGGQGADTLDRLNLIKLEQSLFEGSDGAAYFYNRECSEELAGLTLDGTAGGHPLWRPGRPGTILGLPAWPTGHCSALGDAGDLCLGDFSQYLLLTKGTPDTRLSIHLRFEQDEPCFKSSFRVDGRPAWEQSYRPRKGDATKRESPFLKIAERA